MNDKLFMRGIVCAGAGLLMAQIAPHIAGTPGREPTWAVIIMLGLLVGWAAFTASAFIVGNNGD